MARYHDRADARIKRCEVCETAWVWDGGLCAECRRAEAGLS